MKYVLKTINLEEAKKGDMLRNQVGEYVPVIWTSGKTARDTVTVDLANGHRETAHCDSKIHVLVKTA